MSPEKYNLKQAWSVLVEARKGNGISQHIYNRFADANAMPTVDDPECDFKTYQEFVQYHTRIWMVS